MRVKEKAFAKLNLTLEIGEKRADGYHDLRSVMTCCDLHDTVTVHGAGDITMTCDDSSLACDGSNLCVKAAEVFFADTKIHGGAAILLQKVIPMQAGLGGGSADAAAVLRALRRLYAPDLSDGELERMAEKLGSDVPFCVKSRTALCEGRGERLTPLRKLPKLWYVIVKPEESFATGPMYSALDESVGSRERTTDAMLHAVEKSDKKEIYKNIHNDFHLALPADSTVPEILAKLSGMHAKAAAMSGSGSAVFGIYDNAYKAGVAAMLLQEQGYKVFCAKSV